MTDAHHERRAQPGANVLCDSTGSHVWTELVMRPCTNLFVYGHMTDSVSISRKGLEQLRYE